MKQEKTELMELFEIAKKEQHASWLKSGFTTFKKSLCEFIKVGFDKIYLQQVSNVREANQFIKFRNLEDAYILLVLKKQSNRMALINIETKKKIASLNYYGNDKVSIKQEIEEGATCYVIYSDDESEKKRIKDLKQKRVENKKSSWLDYNSIYYRQKYIYKNNTDKAGFTNKIMDLHIKIAHKFFKHDVNYLIEKISEKERKLYQMYQNYRNETFMNTEIDINLYKLFTPAPFYKELNQMRNAILRLQNIDEKVKQYAMKTPELTEEECRLNYIQECENDIESNYICIIQKEQNFINDIQDFLLINRNTK